MKPILEELRGGDRRSIGKSNQVVAQVLKKPALFSDLIDGMLAADPLVRICAADAVEKITVTHPEWLRPYKRKLIRQIAGVEQLSTLRFLFSMRCISRRSIGKRKE